MKVAICGPANVKSLAELQGVQHAGAPAGHGASPIVPLAGELLKRGHDVTVYTTSNDIKIEYFAQWGRLRVFVGPAKPFGAVRSLYGRERAYLKRVISADRPAFVHAHWTYEFALAAIETGVPVLVTIHDLPWNVLRYFRDRCRLVRLGIAYVVAFRGSQFTAVSDDAAHHFQRFIRPGMRITTIPNFVSDQVLRRRSAPKIHPGRTLRFATVLVGWTRRKNPQTALLAFQKIRRSVPDSELLMIGNDYGPGDQAERWAEQHGCSSGVTFIGPLPYAQMLDRLVKDVDVLIVPSLDESFSMAALEGMTLGIPVIAGAKTPGVREVLDRGRAGLLLDMTDPQDLRRGMKSLQDDAALYNRLAQSGFARALAVYDPEVVTDQYEQAYHAILAAKGPNGRGFQVSGLGGPEAKC